MSTEQAIFRVDEFELIPIADADADDDGFTGPGFNFELEEIDFDELLQEVRA